MLKVVQLDAPEWDLIEKLIDAAHKLRVRSEAGIYRGSMQDAKQVPAARSLAEDLKALIDAVKEARPAGDRAL